jgi:hypothetical protein
MKERGGKRKVTGIDKMRNVHGSEECTWEWGMYMGVRNVHGSEECTWEWGMYMGVRNVQGSEECTREWGMYMGVRNVHGSEECTREWGMYMGVRNVTYKRGGAIYEGKMTPRKEYQTRKRCRRARDKKKL